MHKLCSGKAFCDERDGHAEPVRDPAGTSDCRMRSDARQCTPIGSSSRQSSPLYRLVARCHVLIAKGKGCHTPGVSIILIPLS